MKNSAQDGFYQNSINKLLIEEKIKNSNLFFEHPSYILEKQLAQAIAVCDEKKAFMWLNRINQIGRARLSKATVRSLQYSMIGSCTIFTRAAINGGLDSETAFTLSDIFIRKIDSLFTQTEILEFEYEMLSIFIDAVKQSKKEIEEDNYSPLIAEARKFIRKNNLNKITLTDIADQLHVHPNYLSSQFSKECEMSIMSYYDEVRINSIRHYLQFSKLTLSEIAVLMEFSSFPHFSTYFKKNTGQTPKEFRNSCIAENSNI